jgi:ubiquinone biosynthesis protein
MFVDWDWLVGDCVIATLLPEEYARYRRPIVEGLRRFLTGLPGSAIDEILADQAALPTNASAEERLVTLAERCPALHKLGQILARDRRLDAELRRQLQRLESLPPTTPIATIRTTLVHDLGPLESLGVEVESAPLAEASVAVVVPFRRIEGTQNGEADRGVFKVLKPGIEDRLALELDLLRDVGSLLDDRCTSFGIPRLEYREVFDQVREKLGTEVNLRGEQQHLAHAAATYRHEPDVQIPHLFPFCSSRVTAMERIEGHKVTEPGILNGWDRRKLAGLIVEALIASPLWSPASRASFHADPHAGNLFVTPERRLALLDWSLTGSLGERERVALTQVVLAGLSLNASQMRTGLLDVAMDQRVDEPALDSVIATGLRRVRLGSFPGFSWLTDLLDDAVLRARLRFAPDLVLFRKALHTLEGVLADVSANLQLDEILPILFLRRLVCEWPRRLFTPAFSRSLETRLSSADLALLLGRLPFTPARAWLENTLELLSISGNPSDTPL